MPGEEDENVGRRDLVEITQPRQVVGLVNGDDHDPGVSCSLRGQKGLPERYVRVVPPHLVVAEPAVESLSTFVVSRHLKRQPMASTRPRPGFHLLRHALSQAVAADVACDHEMMQMKVIRGFARQHRISNRALAGLKSEGELPLFRQVPKEVLFRPVFALDIGGDVEKSLKMAPDMCGLERSDFHCR